jgi:hypothetical protein
MPWFSSPTTRVIDLVGCDLVQDSDGRLWPVLILIPSEVPAIQKVVQIINCALNACAARYVVTAGLKNLIFCSMVVLLIISVVHAASFQFIRI